MKTYNAIVYKPHECESYTVHGIELGTVVMSKYKNEAMIGFKESVQQYYKDKKPKWMLNNTEEIKAYQEIINDSDLSKLIHTYTIIVKIKKKKPLEIIEIKIKIYETTREIFDSVHDKFINV